MFAYFAVAFASAAFGFLIGAIIRIGRDSETSN
jgi:hypothetical protein